MPIIDQLIKHDRYVESLCQIINSRYDVVIKHMPLYSKRKRLIGEIDVLAIKDNKCDIYEVKCSYRLLKAKRQLAKIRKLLNADRVHRSYFYCGESGKLEEV